MWLSTGKQHALDLEVIAQDGCKSADNPVEVLAPNCNLDTFVELLLNDETTFEELNKSDDVDCDPLSCWNRILTSVLDKRIKSPDEDISNEQDHLSPSKPCKDQNPPLGISLLGSNGAHGNVSCSSTPSGSDAGASSSPRVSAPSSSNAAGSSPRVSAPSSSNAAGSSPRVGAPSSSNAAGSSPRISASNVRGAGAKSLSRYGFLRRLPRPQHQGSLRVSRIPVRIERKWTTCRQEEKKIYKNRRNFPVGDSLVLKPEVQPRGANNNKTLGRRAPAHSYHLGCCTINNPHSTEVSSKIRFGTMKTVNKQPADKASKPRVDYKVNIQKELKEGEHLSNTKTKVLPWKGRTRGLKNPSFLIRKCI